MSDEQVSLWCDRTFRYCHGRGRLFVSAYSRRADACAVRSAYSDSPHQDSAHGYISADNHAYTRAADTDSRPNTYRRGDDDRTCDPGFAYSSAAHSGAADRHPNAGRLSHAGAFADSRHSAGSLCHWHAD